MQNPLNAVRRLYEALTHRTALFLTETEKVMGISPDISFKTMTKVYLGDLAARASVDFQGDQIAGQGFYTTMNEEYTETSDGKTAKEIVDEFCEEFHVDELLLGTSRYLVGWGNAFWWVGNKKKFDKLEVVPLDAIRDNGIKFDEDSLAEIKLDWNRKPKEIDGDELFHLAFNVMTAKPLGIGILQSLCMPLDIGDGEQREPFYQIKGKVIDGMAQVIYRFGAPNELWSFPGLSEKKLKEAETKIKTIPRRGARFVFNPPKGSEAKVHPIVAERMRGMDKYVETLEDEFDLGLQTPLAKLVTKTGFTEASANAALDIGELHILALKRFLKRSTEYIFDSVVAAAGLDPKQAQVRLNWGIPEQLDYEKLSDLLGHLVTIMTTMPGVIRGSEMRKILRDVAKLPLEEEEAKPEQSMEDKVIVRK